MKKPDGTHLVGIDLGTTYSLVADVSETGPVVLPNHLGELLTPSAVSVDDEGVVLVGAAAKARALRHPLQSALAFKRDMGTPSTWKLGEQTFTPVELSALVLTQLKRDAEAALGGTVSEAVITVPAYFGDAQRQATRDAARLAGLIAERIINEPTAAALAYGFHQRAGTDRIVVLDLGGGTFDVTVLQVLEGVIEVSSSSGDVRLGGEDLTRALVDAHAKHHQLDTQDATVLAALTEACESIKRELTNSSRAARQVQLPNARTKVEFSRLEAESVWKPLVDRMREPIQRALVDAKLSASAIDQVLLVGGSTRVPAIVELARSVFGKEPKTSLPQDEAVALGAAVQAALKIGHRSVEDIVATDIAPFSLGIAAAQNLRRSHVTGVFVPILERGTVLPASRFERFSTMHPMQTEVKVEVFQGEHSMVARNTRLGELKVDKLPPGQINDFDVRFTYDLNGILEVEVTLLHSGEKRELVIDRSGAKLSAASIAEARKRFESLKLHPIDTLPNRTALETAESLFTQLLGEPRSALAEELAAFRAELDGGHKERVEAARKRLLEVVRVLRAQNDSVLN